MSELSFSTAGRGALRATARGELAGERKMVAVPSEDRSMKEVGTLEAVIDARRQLRLISSTAAGVIEAAGSSDSAPLSLIEELSFSAAGRGARRFMGAGETLRDELMDPCRPGGLIPTGGISSIDELIFSTAGLASRLAIARGDEYELDCALSPIDREGNSAIDVRRGLPDTT